MLPPLALQNMRLNTAEEHIQTWIMRMDKCGTLDLEVDLTLEGVRRSRVGKREASTSGARTNTGSLLDSTSIRINKKNRRLCTAYLCERHLFNFLTLFQ
jgi:hypothetical protein